MTAPKTYDLFLSYLLIMIETNFELDYLGETAFRNSLMTTALVGDEGKARVTQCELGLVMFKPRKASWCRE